MKTDRPDAKRPAAETPQLLRNPCHSELVDVRHREEPIGEMSETEFPECLDGRIVERVGRRNPQFGLYASLAKDRDTRLQFSLLFGYRQAGEFAVRVYP